MERTAEGHVPHLLYREESLKGGAALHDYGERKIFMPSSQDPRLEDRKIDNDDVKEIQPEIHIVTDTVFYRLFGSKQSEIITYFGAVLNSVNLRYDTIEDPRVTVKITGFTFNDIVEEEKYIATFGRYGEEFQKYVDMKTTLDNFRDTYRTKQSTLFAKVDVFVLVTGKDMCSLRGNLLSCTVVGQAYVAGACTKYRAVIIEDKPRLYHSVRNMAHELAHSFGCVHDGNGPDNDVEKHPGAQECLWSDGYIMSYIQNSTKEYRFSSCCARQIKHVASLKAHTCLHVNNTERERATTQYLPGTSMTLNRFCKASFADRPRDYYFDTKEPYVDCKVPCRSANYRDNTGLVYSVGKASAIDGIPCKGQDMVCIRGECVPDPSKTKTK
ncbi:A disintegrin and metalloproteinase with thrombospondin motifs like [Ornithodoros turicata]|uniref:A disintegrin and metalloproteinase with thrombospondin motifs like n=1 Tax=Ornithodoros turicata TaxID=34597 RepID=UPI0031391EB4